MELKKSKRIVIKIGSALLADKLNNEFRTEWFKDFVADLAEFNENMDIIIVTSGSVALGKKFIKSKSLKLEEKQAAAASGQIELMIQYRNHLKEHNINCAQILLTISETEDRKRFLNAQNTIETLLENNIIPIINENDTIATREIRYGENDSLSARIAQMTCADVLVLLSDIDGLYTANPKVFSDAKHIPVVEEITSEIEDMADDSVSEFGTGGMKTKIAAVKIARAGGAHTVITQGDRKRPLSAIDAGKRSTWFLSNIEPISARKSWIASSLQPKGDIIIDSGAARAIENGNSLLPAGVIDVLGEFERGDAVVIKDHMLKKIAIGISAHSSDDARLIKGHQSSEIENIIGFFGRTEIIHVNDLVLEKKVS